MDGGSSRDWPALRTALGRARDYAIPWVVGSTDGRRLVASGGALCARAGGAKLDDIVILDVMLPPGCGVGPVIARPELVQLGVTSAPRFRAYIAVHSVAWRPGVSAETPSPEPGVPPLECRRRKLLGADEGGPAAAGVRGSKDKKNRTTGRAGLRLGKDLPGVKILTPIRSRARTGGPGMVNRSRRSGRGNRQGRASRGRSNLTGESRGG